MSDSITKYFQLQEEGKIQKRNNSKSVKESQNTNTLQELTINYSETDILKSIIEIARHYKQANPTLVLQMAKDELYLKKVCS